MASHSSILAWKIPWTEEPGSPVHGDHIDLDTTERLSTHIYFCAGSSLLCAIFFSSCREHKLLSSCCAQASHCSHFSCCGAQALGMWASVVVA